MSELIHLLNGVVVLYRRERSARWQARIKLANKKWHRLSTKETDEAKAGAAAIKTYYELEFRRDNKLPENTRRFDAVAKATVKKLQEDLDAGLGKVVHHSYINSIQLYLIPFFGKYNVDSITAPLLQQFDAWRTSKLGRVPASSTITNHNSALNKVFEYALQHGWITQAVVPVLQNKGKKGKARPAFTLEEYRSLTLKMAAWVKKARMQKSRQMRELMRDYVLILANTGMRHGTEAQKLKWRHIDWITKDGARYLRITVDGKTGSRTLIARANTMDYLKRIQSRFADLNAMDFDSLLDKRVDEYVFRLADGRRTKNLNQTFRQFLRDIEMGVGAASETERTLYSLRHTYATFALKDGIGHHELAKQMGTSTGMIDQYYSKITPELMADTFGGRKKRGGSDN